MSSETFKTLVIDLITCLSKAQLKTVLGNISDSSLEEIMRALVAEKERKGNEEVEKEVEEEVKKQVEAEVKKPVEAEKEVERVFEARGRIIAKGRAPKKVVYGRNNGRKQVGAAVQEGKTAPQPKKRKRELHLNTIIRG